MEQRNITRGFKASSGLSSQRSLSLIFGAKADFVLDAEGGIQVQKHEFMKSFAAKWTAMAPPLVASDDGAVSSGSVLVRGDASAGGGGHGAAGSKLSLTSKQVEWLWNKYDTNNTSVLDK